MHRNFHNGLNRFAMNVLQGPLLVETLIPTLGRISTLHPNPCAQRILQRPERRVVPSTRHGHVAISCVRRCPSPIDCAAPAARCATVHVCEPSKFTYARPSGGRRECRAVRMNIPHRRNVRRASEAARAKCLSLLRLRRLRVSAAPTVTLPARRVEVHAKPVRVRLGARA